MKACAREGLSARRTAATLASIAAVLAVGCKIIPFSAPENGGPPCNPAAEDGNVPPSVVMDFTALGSDFFAAPFPARGRVPGGGIDGYRFPASSPLLYRLRDLVSSDGYATSAAVFFELTGAITSGALLPTEFTAPRSHAPLDGGAAASGDGGVEPNPTSLPAALLFPLDDPASAAVINVEVSTQTVSYPDGAGPQQKVLLSMLPVQGFPLREGTDYVAIVGSSIAKPPAAMTALCAHQPVAGLDSSDLALYAQAISVAGQLGYPCAKLGGISVFHTGSPTAEMPAVQALARRDYQASRGACTLPVPLDREDEGVPRCAEASFCVYTSTTAVQMPQYQRGTPPYLPYLDWGGGWPNPPVPAATPAGTNCVDMSATPPPSNPLASWTPTWRQAKVVVTIPRAGPPSAAGYPIVALVRAGAGGDPDPLVDRGPHLTPSCGETPCRGPAEVFQAVGFAGITIDGPLTGTSRDEPLEVQEDLGIFDFLNPLALRDNLRQSAVELSVLPDIVAQLQIDLSECTGAGTGYAKFDLDHLAIFSHSMGSSIAPLALAADARYGASILSGSGGSLIQNALYKVEPLPINAAGSLYGYNDTTACSLAPHDTALSLLQWSLEPADSEVFARRMVTDTLGPDATWPTPNARNVLMIQGLVDHYILPPIADVMSLGEGLDLGVGPNSCRDDPLCELLPVYGEVATPDYGAPPYPPLADLLPLGGRNWVPLAGAGGNVPWPAGVPNARGVPALTGLVVQHRIDENRESNGGDCSVDGHEVIYESLLARHQYACFLADFARDQTPQIRVSGDEFTACTNP